MIRRVKSEPPHPGVPPRSARPRRRGYKGPSPGADRSGASTPKGDDAHVVYRSSRPRTERIRRLAATVASIALATAGLVATAALAHAATGPFAYVTNQNAISIARPAPSAPTVHPPLL